MHRHRQSTASSFSLDSDIAAFYNENMKGEEGPVTHPPPPQILNVCTMDTLAIFVSDVVLYSRVKDVSTSLDKVQISYQGHRNQRSGPYKSFSDTSA
ncbi:hypothetical protein J6590_007184 [Homalodisca vitripennis]|nr:hypothetical protein J6590_007184 [Homalodisca vitripennis]